MKTIQIELSVQSVNDAIKWLNDYAKSIDKKANEGCEELLKIGKAVAEERFDEIVFDDDDPHVTVEATKTRKTYKLTASAEEALGADGEPHGNRVIFAEFGTGASAGMDHPLASAYNAFPATWSSTYGTGEFAERRAKKEGYWGVGYWHHGGKIHQGYRGAKGMYMAGQVMRQKLVETMRKVFK